MSLQEVVLEVVQDMEKKAKEWKGYEHGDYISQTALLLKMAVKASSSTSVRPEIDMTARWVSNQEAKRLKEMEEERQKVEFQEDFGPRMVHLNDPELVSTVVSIDPKMPIGAHITLQGRVYTLKSDGQLYFDELLTKRNSN